jgi:uncharacterized protein (DUF2267 family)
VLHALRDRLPLEEVVHLGAQLPLLLRGIYYEGWNPGPKLARDKNRQQFTARIQQEFRGGNEDPEELARAVFTLLAERVTAGEIEDVKHVLPEEIRDLWPLEVH